jgi:3-oxoacyl-[acyl-carrier protein] reductase
MTDRVHVFVTGSSRGIGLATFGTLQSRGALVLGHAREEGTARIGGDLGAIGAADRLWDIAEDRLDGRIDVLINNAGIFEPVSVQASDEDWRCAWSRTLQINLQASADLSRRAILHWQKNGWSGRIINVASRAAYRGDSPLHWHYAASKAGMVAMTKSIARGYACDKILAFAICPGFTRTGMADEYLSSRGGDKLLADIPLGRVADACEVANVAAYLALEAPESMTGAVLDVNGASFVR